METIGKIRRRRLVQGESISAIARDLGLSRNTVKRALRSTEDGFEYRRRSQPRPKLGPFLDKLESWLEAEEKLPAREQRTAQRMYEALCLEGYTGSVDTVRRQMRAFERRRVSVSAAFIPQYFAPGEAYQFDFSHEHVELGGVDRSSSSPTCDCATAAHFSWWPTRARARRWCSMRTLAPSSSWAGCRAGGSTTT